MKNCERYYGLYTSTSKSTLGKKHKYSKFKAEMRKLAKDKKSSFLDFKSCSKDKRNSIVSSQKVSFIFSPTFHNHFYDFGFVYFLNGF
jgi:hypothetical protein